MVERGTDQFAGKSQTDLEQPGAALCASNSLILLDYFESVETSDGPHMRGVPGSSPGASTNFLDRIKCAETWRAEIDADCGPSFLRPLARYDRALTTGLNEADRWRA
jgi:hypothetical protein